MCEHILSVTARTCAVSVAYSCSSRACLFTYILLLCGLACCLPAQRPLDARLANNGSFQGADLLPFGPAEEGIFRLFNDFLLLASTQNRAALCRFKGKGKPIQHKWASLSCILSFKSSVPSASGSVVSLQKEVKDIYVVAITLQCATISTTQELSGF